MHDATGSTNDDAKALAREGAPAATVVIAGSQSAGRGRLGRAWHSAQGLGLYLSVLVRPEEPADRLGRFALAAAVATCRACRTLGASRASIKWPNDVLVGHRKLAGILAEMKAGESGRELVLGIGVNVGHGAEDFPADLRDAATSLALAAGAPAPERETVAVELLDALGDALNRLESGAWDQVEETFLAMAPAASGSRVRLATGEAGVTDGLDATGALRVKTGRGIVTVHAGESVAPAED
ncbi:MAG TPA: biotin--[acetyl-CoA-carboxylase] ligase [Candidatus Polarisedimenticolaceae bacterium]|nr:biotin--[acetyl-CoA-carboxylase] ligase [Candidatus Polarisedimenticolaceae bacterium]